MQCPECKYEFQIPKDGVAALTVRTHNREPEPSAMCEVCSYEQRSIPATVYCFDCCQKLCERCSRPHLRWRGGPHDVKQIDEEVCLENENSAHYCDKHKERVRMYCVECDTSVCSTCFVDSHNMHRFERIDVIDFAKFIDNEIEQVTSRIDSFRGIGSRIESASNKLSDSSYVMEREIRNKGEEVKQSFARLIDCQVSDLLDKMQSVRLAAEREVQSRTDAVQLALAELESFRTSLFELKSKCSPSDIVQATSDVRVGASELLQKHVIPAEYLAPSYTFIPADTDQLLTDDRNFIGDVATDIGMHCSFLPSISFNRDDFLVVGDIDSNKRNGKCQTDWRGLWNLAPDLSKLASFYNTA